MGKQNLWKHELFTQGNNTLCKYTLRAANAPNEEAVTLAHVGAALKRAGVVPSDTCPQELLLRAFEREQLIFKSIPKGRKYRHNAVIMNRPAAKDENMPLVCATHEDPYSSHYRDLLMTRSICDWTKSSWVLPHPDVVHFDVAHGKHVRTVLASDGLWDVVPEQAAAQVVVQSAGRSAAANELRAATFLGFTRGMLVLGFVLLQ